MLTGFGAPVERALGMTTIFLVARLLSRERSVLNALGAAALGVLVWNPGALFEASFQMTFLAIVAIAGIAVPMGERSFVGYARAARTIREEWRDARDDAADGAVPGDAAGVGRECRGGAGPLGFRVAGGSGAVVAGGPRAGC